MGMEIVHAFLSRFLFYHPIARKHDALHTECDLVWTQVNGLGSIIHVDHPFAYQVLCRWLVYGLQCMGQICQLALRLRVMTLGKIVTRMAGFQDQRILGPEMLYSAH